MTVARDEPLRLDLTGWSQSLLPTVAVDTVEAFDRLRTLRLEGLQQRGDAERVTWIERSTLWTKRHYLDVYRDHLLFHSEVHGNGSVDTVRFFDAIHDAGFVEHFALTKHFNDHGQTRPREYSTGSPIGFRHVLCPEPNSHARQLVKPFEYAQISVHADLNHRGGNFVANPGLLAFAVACNLDEDWLVMGLAVRPGEHYFSEFEYLGGDTFGLNLNCWGVAHVEGKFYPPAVVLVPGSTAEDALDRYVDVLQDSGIVARPTRSEAAWWNRPIVCGWGHQCYQADLFRVRSGPERPRDNAAYTLCTQLNYRDIVETLDGYDIPWGTLAIDARWFWPVD